jgi:protein-S-isoprenylcysteine O-methyltransferase Ste14
MPDSKIWKFIYTWRVRFGFLGIVLALLLSRPTVISLLVGLMITDVGLLLRFWACGFLRKDKRLAVSGPYRYTRNPLYLGNLIIGIGVVAGSYSVWVALIFLLYFLIFHPVIILVEKTRMKNLFPEEYEEYSQRVPLFFPALRPSLPKSHQKFSLELFQKNKEYRALLGAVIFWTIIAVKLILF